MIGEMIESAPTGDAEVLVRAASGEPDAAHELLDRTGETLYGFIFARVGGRQDAAEDLTQATYFEALRSAHGFRGESTLETWLCAIAWRQIAQYYESERRRFRLERKLQLVANENDADEELNADLLADRDVVISAL